MLYSLFRFLKYIFCLLITLPRDIKGAILFTKIKNITNYFDKTQEGIPDVFMKFVKKHPDKPCIIFNDKIWTFRDFENYGNKVANVFYDRFGLKKGDVVAIFMENKPEFAAIWYGLSKLGVISALINTNLKNKTLIYSIEVAKPKIVIYDEELEETLIEVKPNFTIPIGVIRQGSAKKPIASAANIPKLEDLLSNASEIFSMTEKVQSKDVLMYIYTSGTTGLPKPAIIKHGRYIAGGSSFFYAAEFTAKDVFYVTLPIYHSNAGMIGLGAALVCGATVVLVKKFSASNFFKVAIKHKCTGFSFVGEICRYLLNQPLSELDRGHSIRACVGNGMRGDIQEAFHKRFGIKGVEFYGATEGNCVIINTVGKYGACGFIPLINDYITILPTFIIKIDKNFEPIRDKNGFCIQCDFNEKGLVVGVIGNSTKEEYSGYANQPEQTNKKIIQNLFKPNQRGFNTGDILVRDWLGYTYFVDRVGDTFRWRGENVSTFEVENIMSAQLNSTEVVVYGVEVPGQEGKAGMATILSLNVDMKQLAEHAKKNLTTYAKPLFIRLEEQIEHTGSQKALKQRLIDEGFDISKFKSKTYYFDIKEQNYQELTMDVYNQIKKCQIKF